MSKFTDFYSFLLSNIFLEAKNQAIAKWGKSDEVLKYINFFMDKNNGIRLKVSAPYNNIDYWHSKRNFIEFKEFIDNFKSARKIKKEKQQFMEITDDGNGKLIGKINEYEIWFVNSTEASKQLGRFYKGISSNWCISTDNCEYYWNNDHRNDTFYFLIKDIPAYNEFDKLAFEFKADGTLKIWDLKNRKNTFSNKEVIKYMTENFHWIDKISDSERYFRTPGLKITENSDGTVNVHGTIYLDDLNLTEVPWKNKFKIKELFGDLELNYNSLKDFQDFPEIIHGDLNISENKIESETGTLKSVDGNMDLSENPLKTLSNISVLGYLYS